MLCGEDALITHAARRLLCQVKIGRSSENRTLIATHVFRCSGCHVDQKMKKCKIIDDNKQEKLRIGQ